MNNKLDMTTTCAVFYFYDKTKFVLGCKPNLVADSFSFAIFADFGEGAQGFPGNGTMWWL
jgi:hypothetical protein